MNNCRRISRRVVLTSAALSLGAGTKPTFSEAVSTSVLFQEAMPAGCRINPLMSGRNRWLLSKTQAPFCTGVCSRLSVPA